MLGNLDIVKMASALAEHAANRQVLISRNVANADTPGYRAVDLGAFDPDETSGNRLQLQQSRAFHLPSRSAVPQLSPVAQDGVESSPNGNSVSIEAEMVRAVEIKRQHDLALSIYSSTMGILRSSLGRGR